MAEIERTAALGFKGIVTTGAPHKHAQPYLGDHHWDPIWSACRDAGMSVSFHAANGDISESIAVERIMLDGPAVTFTRAATGAFLDNGQQVTDLLLCGVLARFPDLKFVSVESGLGWIPFVLESCDYHFKKSRVDKEKPEFGDLLPTDLFRRQVYVNYWFERLEPWHVEPSAPTTSCSRPTSPTHLPLRRRGQRRAGQRPRQDAAGRPGQDPLEERRRALRGGGLGEESAQGDEAEGAVTADELPVFETTEAHPAVGAGFEHDANGTVVGQTVVGVSA